MSLLQHLNLYFGYDAKSMKEFIVDFKSDFEDDEHGAVTSLLMFLNEYNKCA